LRIDKDIEDSFFAIIKPDFISAVTKHCHENYIDVQFVNQDDLDLDRKRLDELNGGKSESECDDDLQKRPLLGIDLLGVYFSHHPDSHSPVIKVSPEKVMDVCLSLRAKHGVALPLKNLYPTILNAVVIHELSHWIMDIDSHHHSCGRSMPLSWLISRMEDESEVDFLNGRACYFYERISDKFKSMPLKLWQWRHLIEESLANSFVLAQDFRGDELDIIRLFIELQPPAYRAGMRWESKLSNLLSTAISWNRVKSVFIDDRLWHLYDNPSLFEELVNRLRSQKGSIDSFDFEPEYQRIYSALGQSNADRNNKERTRS
jgi:hypothetical protein